MKKDLGAEIERAARSLAELASRLREQEAQQLQAGKTEVVIQELVDRLVLQAKTSDQPRAMPVKRYAAVHGVSASTIWRLIKRGELRSLRIGGRIVVPLDQSTPAVTS
jgi:predicted DNA-binding transcriptional regulator AlpA